MTWVSMVVRQPTLWDTLLTFSMLYLTSKASKRRGIGASRLQSRRVARDHFQRHRDANVALVPDGLAAVPFRAEGPPRRLCNFFASLAHSILPSIMNIVFTPAVRVSRLSSAETPKLMSPV